MQNKKLIIIAIVLMVIVSGFSLIGYFNKDKNTFDNVDSKLIINSLGYKVSNDYSGKEITALDLLKLYASVNTTNSKYGEFVNCINDICSDQTKNTYWSYYINDKMAAVGAGDYHIKNNDSIEFRYG